MKLTQPADEPMKDVEVDRRRAVERLADHLERWSGPRFLMFWIVVATGIAGFFASVGLLRIGIVWMSVRYALAIVVAYAIFLFLIWLWVLHRRGVEAKEIDDVVDGGEPDLRGHSSHFDARSPSGDSGGGLDLDLGDLVVIVAFVAAVACACIAALYVVYTAPALLAEVLLDGVLSAGLYRRFRRVERREWLTSAVVRTRVPVIVTALFFIAAGAVGQWYAPGAVSFGGVWRHLTDNHVSGAGGSRPRGE
jgi:hypothetical protein